MATWSAAGSRTVSAMWATRAACAARRGRVELQRRLGGKRLRLGKGAGLRARRQPGGACPDKRA
eukprot:2470476-Alexandrium_andersonii.AAC.1